MRKNIRRDSPQSDAAAALELWKDPAARETLRGSVPEETKNESCLFVLLLKFNWRGATAGSSEEDGFVEWEIR